MSQQTDVERDPAFDYEAYLQRPEAQAEQRKLDEMTRALNDSFYVPTHDLGLLVRLDDGDEPKTDEEKRVADALKARELLQLRDVADVMRAGSSGTEMLVDGVLVEHEYHVVFGPPESAKTWFVLVCVLGLLQKGRTVVWVDEEMGLQNIADRLLALGATPEQVDAGFVYLEYPALDGSDLSRKIWTALLAAKKPALVVVDARTEVLAAMGLNENLATDNARWDAAYLSPARRERAAVVVIDHTGHDEQGRPRASMHKIAAAKIMLSVTRTAPFDAGTLGAIEVRLTKNSVSADIPEVQNFQLGGDSEGGFLLLPMAGSLAPSAGDERAGAAWRIRVAAEAYVREHADEEKFGATAGVTLSQVRGSIGGTTAKKTEALASLAGDPNSRVQTKPGSREGSLLYFWASVPSGDLPSGGSVTGHPDTDGRNIAGGRTEPDGSGRSA